VDAAFYFDLSSPLAYLAAERILPLLGERAPVNVEWQPVLARELPGASTFEAFRCETEAEIFRMEVERRARELSLQPLRWPQPFPFDSTLAMHVATYAKSIGRTVPFAQAAFRQAFAGGHNLERPEFVLIAAAACEMHPQAILRAAELRSVRERLVHTTAQAARAGVGDVPAVVVDLGSAGERVFAGERALEDAALCIRAGASTENVAGQASSAPEQGAGGARGVTATQA
jgi:2-hydroxychromene-2-carboxylate isomerase